MPPPTGAEVGASATYVGARIILRINTVTCAEVSSIGLAIVRSEIELVVENQYNRFLRQQQTSKALSASGGTTTVDREKNRRPRNRFEGTCFNCGRKGHRAEDCRGAKKKTGKSRDAAADWGGGRGKCYVCGSEDHFARKHCDLCRSLKHRTRDC